MNKALLILFLLLLSGCSETPTTQNSDQSKAPTTPNVDQIELDNEANDAKNAEKCQFESDVITAQSNWITDDYTETEDLISPECKE